MARTGDVGTVTLEKIERTLGSLVRLSKPWVAFVTALAILSTVKVSWASGGFSVAFEVTVVTVSLVTLVWAPALIRVLAVAGGGIKTPAGEIQTVGLTALLKELPDEVKREALPPVIAALDQPQVATRADARFERTAFLDMLTRASPSSHGAARADVAVLARGYEELRERLPSGAERTFRMGVLVAEIQALAPIAAYRAHELAEMFATGRDGDRLVAIVVLEVQPSTEGLQFVLAAISDSRSAFEQFRALLTLEALMPLLDGGSREAVTAFLRELMSGRVQSHLNPAAHDRWTLATRILRRLTGT